MNDSYIDVLTAKPHPFNLLVVCHVLLMRKINEELCSQLSNLVDQTVRQNPVTTGQRIACDDSILIECDVAKSYFLQLQKALR